MKYLIPLFLLLGSNCWAQNTNIHFATNDVTLDKNATKTCQTVVDSFKTYCNIILVGHTDSIGSFPDNLDLSRRRCESTKHFLLQAGIPDSAISFSFKGEIQPKQSNYTADGRYQNRRVEILLQCNEPEETGNIQDLYALLRSDYQYYSIDPTKDTIIQCKNGTVIHIQKDAYKPSKNCINNKVELQIKEAFDLQTMISENLSTTSNGKIIESGGMVYINAIDCKTLPLNPKNNGVSVFVPNDFNLQNTMLFNGVQDPHNSSINWVGTGRVNSFSGQNLGGCFPDDIIEKKCNLFFCEVFSTISGAFNTDKREYTKFRRRVKKRINNGKPPFTVEDFRSCSAIQKLMSRYGVDDIEDLLIALGIPPTFNERLLISALMDTAYKQELRDFEKRIDSQNVTLNELNYYIFNMKGVGWRNIDAFLKMPPEQLATISIDFPLKPNTDCKLVFEDRRILLSGIKVNDKTEFYSIPKGEIAYIVAMKYDGEKTFLNVQKIKIEDNAKYKVDLHELSLEEFKQELAKISW